MWPARIILAVLFIALIATPLVVKSADDAPIANGARRQLIIVTPHVEQIRTEFQRAFSEWHLENYGETVAVQYRVPGGTSEIIKQLTAQYKAAWDQGRIDPDTLHAEPGSVATDLMFGGGSYDHGRLIRNLRVAHPDSGEEVTVPMSVPAGFSQQQLDFWYGENSIGVQNLYHPEQYWMGNALSSFGIVYNKDVYEALGIETPDSFDDLADPRLQGWVALADPRQSGSITTTFDSIISHYGWDKGWRVLRAMSANARYFTNSSTKPPLDVSYGDCAVGLAIDFYGRGQSQSVLLPGQSPDEGRVGYVDPPGEVYIDADPVSILRGGPEPELAKRFVEFLLTEKAQSMWQFDPSAEQTDDLGPRRHALRRMPVRRMMYERHFDRFMDRVNPFEIAGDTESAGWRSSIGPMMGAFAIDTHHECRGAWKTLNLARASAGFPSSALDEMENLFFAMPDHTMPDGTVLPFTSENYRPIRNSWRDRDHPDWASRSQIRYTEFFRSNYRRIADLYQENARADAIASTESESE